MLRGIDDFLKIEFDRTLKRQQSQEQRKLIVKEKEGEGGDESSAPIYHSKLNRTCQQPTLTTSTLSNLLGYSSRKRAFAHLRPSREGNAPRKNHPSPSQLSDSATHDAMFVSRRLEVSPGCQPSISILGLMSPQPQKRRQA